jgi:GT2 family glycosyltransferase
MKDTIECIESINKLKINKGYSIIVVDNASMSNEDVKLIKKYTKDIVLLKENVGFANGNNIGCKYAIDKYNPDFLIVINNDTLILQSDFVGRIYSCYKKTKFDILGPKILTDGGESVNPFPAYKTLDEIRYNIAKSKKLIKIYQNPFLRNLLNIYMTLKKIIIKPVHLENGKYSMMNVALHGCALIFSKKYYKKYSDVFYSGTFLYHEEEFLEYRREKDNLITYYDSDIEIFHKEGSSLDMNFNKSKYKKLIFRNKYIIDSLSKLEEIKQNSSSI